MTFHVEVNQAPTDEVVGLQELKDYARVDGDDDNEILALLIPAATAAVEARVGRALLQQTLVLHLDAFRDPTRRDAILLPRPPVASVTEIRYTDAGGTQRTVTAATYTVETTVEPAMIFLAQSQSWPTSLRLAAAVEVEYVAGYGTSPTDVPAALRHAVKRVARLMYEGGCVDCTDDPQVQSLIQPYRVLTWG